MSDTHNSHRMVTAEQLSTIPLAVLRDFERTSAENFWRILDEERERGKKLGRSWPSSIFADDSVYGAAFTQLWPINSFAGDRVDLIRRFSIFAALGAWRITRCVYCFDSELSSALAYTDPSSQIPAEVFMRLPEWGVCIFGEELSADATVICAFVSCGLGIDGIPRLSIVELLSTGLLMPIDIKLESGVTVHSTYTSNLEAVRRQAIIDPARIESMTAHQAGNVDRISRILTHVLYLCIDDPDMDAPPARPQATKTKSGSRFFPPDGGARIVQVGARFGAAFRRERAAQSVAADEYYSRTGRAMPPHVRRAHWHRFMTGSRKADPRTWVIKWIAPILVNVTDEDLPVVVHPVEYNACDTQG